ncbi:MAG TPA: phosphotransferase [Kineosporiaceae bacterium]|nr:phosphotransferase [Kineosporiaceae bacterium]
MIDDADEAQLVGNLGGAVRVGDTVRRPTGPWTPAVHALLEHLGPRVPHIPRVLGIDDRGREVLSYLPGTVIDHEAEQLTVAQLASLVRWTRGLHEAVIGFSHKGPWRYFPVERPTLIGHNDIAPYNACFRGDKLAGVFDWDLAGPTTPLFELAFIAWNGVPLWQDLPPQRAAERLGVIAAAYGGFTAQQILRAVPARVQLMLDGIPAAAAAGDQGMANLLALGEPERSRRSLADLVGRMPAIDHALGRE